nr:baseplate J/gp47 family protein [uncultured Kingella sp.]
MAEIDLTQLPAPDAVEQFDFETIFARKKQQLVALCPESIKSTVAATLELESEPLTIDLQQQAYSELLVRQRINEAVRATFLAFAAGADLDHIGASRGLKRKTIQAADPAQNPPVPEILETDEAFRRRIQMHPEKFAAAGPRAAYIAHALDIEGVADANAVRPEAGKVRIYIKAETEDGIAGQELLSRVQTHLSAEDKRPLCDTVQVLSGSPKTATVRYQTRYQSQLGKELVKKAQEQALAAVLAENRHLGARIALSKIIGALDVVGAEKVVLTEPQQDIVCHEGEFISISQISGSEIP